MPNNDQSLRWTPLSAVLVSLAVFVLLVVLPWPWQVVDPADPVTSAALMACAGVLWALAGWAVLLVTVGLLGHASGPVGALARRWAGKLAPWAGRGLVTAALGLGAGWTPAAAAAPPVAEVPVAEMAPTVQQGAGGESVLLDLDWPDPVAEPDAPGIDWPATADQAPASAKSAGPATGPDGLHVVLRGDTLWDIAAAHLPADATDPQIAEACDRWYQANRDLIGPDPDLILPGQVLSPPAPDLGVPS